jgi:hypothetical protein
MATKIHYCRHTGLLYVNGVAFTREKIQKVKEVIDQKDNQFEYGVLVIDRGNGSDVLVAEKMLHDIEEAASLCNVASDKDFED